MENHAPAWFLRQLQAEKTRGEIIPVDDWPWLLSFASATDTAGLMAYSVHASGQSPPEAIGAELSRLFQAEQHRGAFFFVEAQRINDTLAAGGVEALFLKGLPLARTVYEHPACRAFRDLDLLVAPEFLDRALTRLAGLGYSFVDPEAVQKVHRRHHFHIAMAGPGRPRLEVHWNLTRPDDPYRLEPEVLFADALRPDGVGGLRCPHPDGQVLHATVSLLRCGFTQLKRIIDLDRIIRSESPLRWPRIVECARSRGLEPALRLLLELTELFFGTPLEEPLRLVAPLGHRRRRLEDLGIERFPLALPPSAWAPARHMVRFWLAERPGRVIRMFLGRPAFERARVEAFGIGRRVRLQAAVKRALIAAYLAAWQCALYFRPHRQPRLLPITDAPPSSAPPGGGRGGSPEQVP